MWWIAIRIYSERTWILNSPKMIIIIAGFLLSRNIVKTRYSLGCVDICFVNSWEFLTQRFLVIWLIAPFISYSVAIFRSLKSWLKVRLWSRIAQKFFFLSFVRNLLSYFRVEGMAGHNDSTATEKKSSDSSNDIPNFNAENLQSNMKIIYYRFVLTTYYHMEPV